MSDVWQRATVMAFPTATVVSFLVKTEILHRVVGAGGDVAKKAREELRLQVDDIVEIKVGPEHRYMDVKDVRLINSAAPAA